METINDIIGRNIRRLRREKGWTQIKLSKLLFCCPNLIGQWELGKCAPSAHYLDRLASVMECSIDELFRRRQAK